MFLIIFLIHIINKEYIFRNQAVMEANNDFKSRTATTPFYFRELEDDSKEESKFYK